MRIFNGVRFRAWFLSLLVCGFWQSYATAGLITFGSDGNQFTMNFVDIGNAGNADDTTGTPNPAGAVAYAYGLGKYEVSEDMITKFNASQALQITKDTRGVDKPVTNVSWNEAARFTNWLNTSTGGSAAYKFTTSGVNDNIALWGSGDVGYDALNPYRNSLATYVLPSMDEWYKAAYYNPTTGTYFDFPNGSDTAPTAVASGIPDRSGGQGRGGGEHSKPSPEFRAVFLSQDSRAGPRIYRCGQSTASKTSAAGVESSGSQSHVATTGRS